MSAIVVWAAAARQAEAQIPMCSTCTSSSSCTDACISSCDMGNPPTCQVSTCGDSGKCTAPEGGCAKFCGETSNCGKSCMDSSGFVTQCSACSGSGMPGSGGGGCGPLFHPSPAVGRLFIRSKTEPDNLGLATKCTAVLIAPQYFVVPATCVGSVAVAGEAGDWAMWASTRDGFNADAGAFAEVDRIFSLGSRADHNIALGRLRSIPDVAPVRIRALPPSNGRDLWVVGHGTGQPNVCRNSIAYHRFDWPDGHSWPTERGAAALVSLDDGLMAIAGDGNNDGWVHVTKFREEIFGMIRALENGFERGIDRFGADIDNGAVVVDSVLACQDVCERNNRCTSFAFLPKTGDCFPKAAIPAPIPNREVISGLPRAFGAFDRPGADWERAVKPAANATECSALCGRDIGCAAFAFENGACTLKWGIPVAGDCLGGDCRSGSYRREVDFDRYGADLGASLKFGNSVECSLACAKNPNCRAWTFGVPRAGGAGSCWLKSKAVNPGKNTEHPTFFPLISGLRKGIDYQTGRPGNNYRQFDAGAPEPERCQSTCENEAACVAWAMTTSPTGRGNTCFLKNAIPAQAPGQPGVMSGIKGGFKY